MIEIALLAALVFCSALLVDYAHARYAFARDAGRVHASARWGLMQWAAASVGFVVAVKVSLYALPFEGLGLYCGTILASTKRPELQYKDRGINLASNGLSS